MPIQAQSEPPHPLINAVIWWYHTWLRFTNVAGGIVHLQPCPGAHDGTAVYFDAGAESGRSVRWVMASAVPLVVRCAYRARRGKNAYGT